MHDAVVHTIVYTVKNDAGNSPDSRKTLPLESTIRFRALPNTSNIRNEYRFPKRSNISGPHVRASIRLRESRSGFGNMKLDGQRKQGEALRDEKQNTHELV